MSLGQGDHQTDSAPTRRAVSNLKAVDLLELVPGRRDSMVPVFPSARQMARRDLDSLCRVAHVALRGPGQDSTSQEVTESSLLFSSYRMALHYLCSSF